MVAQAKIFAFTGEGLITLASSRKHERSWEWPERKQGIFTYFLAEGLRGEADADANGIVNSDEIYQYLFNTVPRTAKQRFNSRQTPVRLIGEDVVGVFDIAIPKTTASMVSVRPKEPEVHRTIPLRISSRLTFNPSTVRQPFRDYLVENPVLLTAESLFDVVPIDGGKRQMAIAVRSSTR